MTHVALGRLRGRAEPREDILDRLLRVHSQYRLYWAPASGTRPGYWEIYQFHANPLRQKAGFARLERVSRMYDTASESEKLGMNLGLWRDCEHAIDQVQFVAMFTEEQFGGDWMFKELGEGESNLKAAEAQFYAACDRADDDDIIQEVQANDDFSKYTRDVAEEWYTRVFCGHVQAAVNGLRDTPKPTEESAA